MLESAGFRCKVNFAENNLLMYMRYYDVLTTFKI